MFNRNKDKVANVPGETTAEADEALLEPPKGTLGLQQVYPKPATRTNSIDVVFVHGLGGDAYSTWTKEKTLWFRDLLPQSPFYQDARILTFGYDARAFMRPFERSTKGRTFTFAESLLADLDIKRVSPAAKRRPIIFCGHSLGGIVIKAALRHAHERESLYGDILRATRAIAFFGTPHQGADLAVWAGYLGGVGKAVGVRNTEVVEELQRWSNPLVELTTTFAELAPQFDLTTFFESQKTSGVMVVPEGAAKIGQKNERARAMNADHREICRFEEDDSNWQIVSSYMDAIAERIEEANDIALPEAPTMLPATRDNKPGRRDELTEEELLERLQKLRAARG